MQSDGSAPKPPVDGASPVEATTPAKPHDDEAPVRSSVIFARLEEIEEIEEIEELTEDERTEITSPSVEDAQEIVDADVSANYPPTMPTTTTESSCLVDTLIDIDTQHDADTNANAIEKVASDASDKGAEAERNVAPRPTPTRSTPPPKATASTRPGPPPLPARAFVKPRNPSVPPLPSARRPASAPPRRPSVRPTSLPAIAPRPSQLLIPAPNLDDGDDTPTPLSTGAMPAPGGAGLVEMLTARIDRLKSSSDKVGLARALVELALFYEDGHETHERETYETVGDSAHAKVEAAASLSVQVAPDMAAAHAILRRHLNARTEATSILHHLECELAVAASDAVIAELHVTRARLLEASGRDDDAREAWRLALGRAPQHAAALKGLESNLFQRACRTSDAAPLRLEARPADKNDGAWEDLVAHLGQMGDAYAAQPNLAAWLHVERARILDMQLGRLDAARSAYQRALALDSGIGPVRDAFTLFAASHHDAACLAELLTDEARLEPNSVRCARLELDAACIAHTRLNDDARAMSLLEQAAARAPTTPLVDRRVLDDLVRLYEHAGQWPEASRTRRLRLRFFTDASALAYELERLANIEERLGHVDLAIDDVRRALSFDPHDATLVGELDRLLAAAGNDSDRIALWLGEAEREEDGPKRARTLCLAAKLCTNSDRRDEALRHLRAAWVAAPGDSEIIDELSRMMSPAPNEAFDHDVRALIELYAQAAQATRDTGRRVAYLEKVALLWEEVGHDPLRAARTYEELLRLEPGRRGAILGLERTAGRIGDDRALAGALLEESKLAGDGVDVLGLRVRSAEALVHVDLPRASSLIAEVLEQDKNHVRARALESRLHEQAGRWEQAAASLRARIDLASQTRDKVDLWLSLARIYDVRLRSPKDAIKCLQSAHKCDPIHPVPPEEIARILETAGDFRTLRDAAVELATDAGTPLERARNLTLAAEIDELRLHDDVGAATLYARALAEVPGDKLLSDRLLRVLWRRVVTTTSRPGRALLAMTPAWNDLLAHLATQPTETTTDEHAAGSSLLLASLLAATQSARSGPLQSRANRDGRDGGDADVQEAQARAIQVLESIIQADPHHVGALRTLEAMARRDGELQNLARILRLEGEGFADIRARLGSFWELASLEAFSMRESDSCESLATYTRILDLDPTDLSGLEAVARISLQPAREGRESDASARARGIAALRSLSALTRSEGTRLSTDMRLGLLLEAQSKRDDDGAASSLAAREALERMRDVLSIDPLSVTAATSLARLANRLGDTAGATAAAISLADLSTEPRLRAKCLFDASSLVLSSETASATLDERREQAAQLLEKAIESDPNSIAIAKRLLQVRHDQGLGERLIDVFRAALARATNKSAIVFLGTEIAQIGRNELDDIGLAIDAMRKVREAWADHIPSLLTLSELLIAQRAWTEAIDTLENVALRGHEPGPRIRALLALANIYGRVLGRPSSAEDALRRAVAIENDNPDALRGLIQHLVAKLAKQSASTADTLQDTQDTKAAMLEIASLLERLAAVEHDPQLKCDVLIEFADVCVELKDIARAEAALVEAVASAPSHPRAFERFAQSFSGTTGECDAVSYARALAAVIDRGRELGTEDARWYASLGHLELEQLDRPHDAVVHLGRAIEMNADLYPSRFELAVAHSCLGTYHEASQHLVAMLEPAAAPLLSLATPESAIEMLERTLYAEGRAEEAIVASELCAIAGELDEGRRSGLRSRRLGAWGSDHAVLDRATLINQVMPSEGNHVLLDIALATAGLEARFLSTNIAEIGITSRDRVSKRSRNSTRVLFDRLASALGIPNVDLVVTPNVTRTRVVVQNATWKSTWIVVPLVLTELPEPTQLASLGRALARVALGVPGREELPPAHLEAILIAAARTVYASYGTDEADVVLAELIRQVEPTIIKNLSRKHKLALAKLAPYIKSPQGRLVATDVFELALARAEARIAYLLTGDLLATIDELQSFDDALRTGMNSPGTESLRAVLHHPVAGDVVRFALTTGATALRRRVGSTWGPPSI